METEAPVLRTLSDLALCISSSVHLYPLSYPLLYNESENIIVFPEFAIFANNATQGRGHGNPDL